jgi:hypothetical protein
VPGPWGECLAQRHKIGVRKRSLGFPDIQLNQLTYIECVYLGTTEFFISASGTYNQNREEYKHDKDC